MRQIIKQLLIGAIILVLVTVLSFGIRQVRLSIYRADIAESTASARPSSIENQLQAKQPIYAEAETDYYTENLYIVDAEDDIQYTDEPFGDEQASADEYDESKTDMGKKDKALFKTESFKGDYANAEGKKDHQKISLGEFEDLYITKEGEYWYVSEQPDGSTTKMQLKIDDYTDELIAVGGGFYANQEPQRILIGDREDIYLTEEGEAWYVSEQPDGDTLKMQVQID